MRLLHVVIGVFVIVPVVFGDVLKPPRVVAKNVHKSHVTHHNLNTEGEERLQKAETGYYPSEDSCAKALNVSKVALMFLTRGYIQHHDTWDLWFKDAQGMLPLSAMQAEGCTADAISTAGHSCGMSGGPTTLHQQHLFSVLTHVGAAEDFAGFPKESRFHGTVVPTTIKTQWGTLSRITAILLLMEIALDDPLDQRLVLLSETQWGTHSLTKAILLLMEMALEEPLNQRFVLLSESDIPLYPPAVVWLQLMSERKSRIHACNDHFYMSKAGRWTGELGNGKLQPHHWRLSDTWFMLTRHHVDIITEEYDIEHEFAVNCAYFGADPTGWRHCFSDQHLFATILAHNKLENETACNSTVTNPGSGDPQRPHMFEASEVSYQRLIELRIPDDATCRDTEAIRLAEDQVAHVSAFNATVCNTYVPPFGNDLAPSCPLFARKFGPEVADVITRVMDITKFLRSPGLLSQMD